jgi:hypothetical protein
VSGAASALDSIDTWPTEPIQARGLDANFTGIAQLLGVGADNLQVDAQTVTFRVVVEEYTQRDLDVRLQTIGGQRDSSLRILPHNIRVSFEVPLSRYDAISADQFRAVVDLGGLSDTSDNMLDVVLDRIPPEVRRVDFQPPYAEYFYVKQTRKEQRETSKRARAQR